MHSKNLEQKIEKTKVRVKKIEKARKADKQELKNEFQVIKNDIEKELKFEKVRVDRCDEAIKDQEQKFNVKIEEHKEILDRLLKAEKAHERNVRNELEIFNDKVEKLMTVIDNNIKLENTRTMESEKRCDEMKYQFQLCNEKREESEIITRNLFMMVFANARAIKQLHSSVGRMKYTQETNLVNFGNRQQRTLMLGDRMDMEFDDEDDEDEDYDA